MILSKDDHAVSPVMGTILLVAITVVLGAIIAAVILGLADGDDMKKVGMNAQPLKTGGSSAQLVLYGGAALDELVKLEMIDQDSHHGFYVELWNITSGSAVVGMPYTANGVAQPLTELDVYDTRINVKGTFADGREVILLVQPMTFYNVEPAWNNNIIVDSSSVNITYLGGGNDGQKTIRFGPTTTKYALKNQINSGEAKGFVQYKVNGTSAWSAPIEANLILNGFNCTIMNTFFDFVTYDIRAIIVTADGTKLSSDTKQHTRDYKGWTQTIEKSGADNITFSYGNLNTLYPNPTAVTVYYKDNSTGKIETAGTYTPDSKSGYIGAKKITGLTPGTEYIVWGEMYVGSYKLVTDEVSVQL